MEARCLGLGDTTSFLPGKYADSTERRRRVTSRVGTVLLPRLCLDSLRAVLTFGTPEALRVGFFFSGEVVGVGKITVPGSGQMIASGAAICDSVALVTLAL